MTIIFADKKLEKMTADYVLCCRKLGAVRAEILFQRIYALDRVKSMADLSQMPGRFHKLSGNRRGQWACDLGHPYRMVFRPVTDLLPNGSSGSAVWSTVNVVEIIEITDYH